MNKRNFMCFPMFRDKTLTFSYDDAVVHDKRLVEIFQKYGLKATFNINTSFLGKDGIMTKEQAIELYTKANMEIAIHGYRHLSLSNVDSAVATNDVILDRREHEKAFNRIVKGMAYANGSYDDKVVEILKNCGVKYARTVDQTCTFDLPENWLKWHPTCHHENPKLMELAKTFVDAKRGKYFWFYPPKVFYVWGHSYEFNGQNNWHIIEEFAQYISNRGDIWYATNGEIYDYVKAYDSLEWSVECNYVHNPTAIDVYINYFGTQYVVGSGKTIYIEQKEF